MKFVTHCLNCRFIFKTEKLYIRVMESGNLKIHLLRFDEFNHFCVRFLVRNVVLPLREVLSLKAKISSLFIYCLPNWVLREALVCPFFLAVFCFLMHSNIANLRQQSDEAICAHMSITNVPRETSVAVEAFSCLSCLMFNLEVLIS